MMSSGDRISLQGTRHDDAEKTCSAGSRARRRDTDVSPIRGRGASPRARERSPDVARHDALPDLFATSHARFTTAEGLAPNALATPSISRSTSTCR